MAPALLPNGLFCLQLPLARPAGQLGTVGRQLGAILVGIVQQLRSTKLMWGGKSCKVYELVFGKVVSGAVACVCAGDTRCWHVLLLPNMRRRPVLPLFLPLTYPLLPPPPSAAPDHHYAP